MTVSLKWHGPVLQEALKSATLSGLNAGTQVYHSRCLMAVGVPNTGTSVRRMIGGKRRSFTVYGSPSAPGEPPRKRTGFGQRNIVWESNGDKQKPATRTGVAAPGMYMFYLEVGTRHVAARPWLLVSLFAYRPEIVAAMEMAMRAEAPK